jgi:uncharacterized protein (TIGR02001 family)
MKKIKLFALCTAFMSITAISVSAEDAASVAPVASTPITLTATSDLVSSYVWRGLLQGSNTPNFQPTVSLTYGGFTLGTWGSGSFDGKEKELDFFATYVFSPSFAITVTDYDWTFGTGKNYFDYTSSTEHLYEASLAYTGPSSLPFSISLNTMFYGADKNGNSQAYSTYVELDYQATAAAKLFLGASLMESDITYGTTGFGVINAGAKVTRSIAITDKFSLPVYGVIGANPNAKNVYLVFGITL